MKYIALFALIAVASSHKLEKKSSNKHAADFVDATGEEIDTSMAVQIKDRMRMTMSGKHACDYVDDSGEEKSTSLMPEY